MRMFQAVAEQVTGLHQLMASFVDRRACMVDGAQHGEAVGHLRHAREMLAKLNARDVSTDRLEAAPDGIGSVGLRIPRIELARSTHQEQQNTVDVLVDSASGQRVEVRKSQTNGSGAKAAHAQEVTS